MPSPILPNQIPISSFGPKKQVGRKSLFWEAPWITNARHVDDGWRARLAREKVSPASAAQSLMACGRLCRNSGQWFPEVCLGFWNFCFLEKETDTIKDLVMGVWSFLFFKKPIAIPWWLNLGFPPDGPSNFRSALKIGSLLVASMVGPMRVSHRHRTLRNSNGFLLLSNQWGSHYFWKHR